MVHIILIDLMVVGVEHQIIMEMSTILPVLGHHQSRQEWCHHLLIHLFIITMVNIKVTKVKVK